MLEKKNRIETGTCWHMLCFEVARLVLNVFRTEYWTLEDLDPAKLAAVLLGLYCSKE